jgi:DNA-binding transcriptional regulator YiaG
MGKMEGVFKTEMVRSLKRTASEFRKTILGLKQFADRQRKQLEQKEAQLTTIPEEIKKARFSPRLIKTLRKRLGLSQRELATLSGVTVGAVHQWETGKFVPKDEKKGVFVALRKLGRREARRLLSSKTVHSSSKRPKRRASRRKNRK